MADDVNYQARFFREAREAMRLHHPHIVRVFHADRSADGLCYLIMEFVAGTTLTELVPDKGMSERRAVEWLIPLCEALAHAHSMGLIHRDIKPDNILVDAKTRQPRITDFGLLRDSAAASITHANEIIGTPAFMPPEQWRGTELTGASDIYSLGVTAFFMLTHRMPIEGGSPPDVLHKLLRRERLELTTVRPAIDTALASIVERMMALSTLERYRHATDIAHDLREWLAEHPITKRIHARSFAAKRKSHVHHRGLSPLSWFIVVMTTLALAALGVTIWVAIRFASN